MQPGTLDRGLVETPTLTVLLNGAPAEVSAFSLAREVNNASIDGSSSGMIAATGSLTLTDSSDPVSSKPRTPWSVPKTPSPGATVEAVLGIGGGAWTIFTGRVETNTGTIVGGLDGTAITDALPELNARVDSEASSSYFPLTTYPSDLTGGPGGAWGGDLGGNFFSLGEGLRRILGSVTSGTGTGTPTWVALPPGPAGPAPTKPGDGTGAGQKWLLKVPATAGEAPEVGTQVYSHGNGEAGPDGRSWSFRTGGAPPAPAGFSPIWASGYECVGAPDLSNGFSLTTTFHRPTVDYGQPASAAVWVYDGTVFDPPVAKLICRFEGAYNGKPGTVSATCKGLTEDLRLGWEAGAFWLWRTPDGRIALQSPSGEKVTRKVAGGQWVTAGRRPIVQISTSAFAGGWSPVSGVALSDGGRNAAIPAFPYSYGTDSSGADTVIPPDGTYAPTGPANLPGFTPGFQGGPEIIMPPDASWPQIKAVPGISEKTGLDVIKEISDALIWPTWVDEFGRLIILRREDFGAGVVRVLTSKESLVDLGWSESADALRGRTTVRYREAVVQHTDRAQVQLWQSPTVIQVGSGRPFEVIIGPKDANEDWAGLPEGSMMQWASLSAAQAANPTGHWIGGVNNAGAAQAAGQITGTVSRIDGRRWRVSIAAIPAGPCSVILPASQGWVGASAWNNANAPVVRGSERFTWTDKSVNAVDDGVISADPLDHEVGWVLQKAADAQTLADWIAAAYAAGKGAVIDSVEILLDPRVQIGDPVRLEDSDRSGVWVEGVVTGVSFDIGSTWTQTLSLRVRSAGLLP